MGYEWDFGVVVSNFDLLLLGFWGTLKITGVSLAFGMPLGLAVALLRLVPYRIVSAPAGVFIDVFRTTPPLVQLYWFFFALPILLGIRIDPFEAAILTFSLQSSSFFAEVIRGGILSIERGQWEAGRGLGMTYSAVMRRVVLPQAFKRMIPPLLNRMIELMKTTTLVAAIAYADLLYQANSISQSTYRPLEVYSAAAAIYFVTLFALSLAVRGLERRLAVTGESGG